jgi:opacity protein-like surface antigen
MKRFAVVLFLILLALGTLSAHAQVVPSAAPRHVSITAGGMASIFQPDYAGGGVPEASDYPLVGVGAYVDVTFSRWVQLEAEARWQRFNQYLDINEDNYLIGPRVPIRRIGRATPYAKVLFGFGDGSFVSGRVSSFAYGGGVDYKLTKRITVRAIDFEYQQWRVTPTLHPYGASMGIGYRIF